MNSPNSSSAADVVRDKETQKEATWSLESCSGLQSGFRGTYKGFASNGEGFCRCSI